MNIFEKLSNPLYFSKFGNRLIVTISILSLFLWGYLIDVSISNNKVSLVVLWVFYIILSVYNLFRSIAKLRKMK
jgi:hypothetical protein